MNNVERQLIIRKIYKDQCAKCKYNIDNTSCTFGRDHRETEKELREKIIEQCKELGINSEEIKDEYFPSRDVQELGFHFEIKYKRYFLFSEK